MRVIFLTLPKPGEEKLQSKARWAREKRVLGKHFDVLSVGWASGARFNGSEQNLTRCRLQAFKSLPDLHEQIASWPARREMEPQAASALDKAGADFEQFNS